MTVAGSRYLKEPFECASEHRFEATERIMALQFDTVEKRLERIESMNSDPLFIGAVTDAIVERIEEQ